MFTRTLYLSYLYVNEYAFYFISLPMYFLACYTAMLSFARATLQFFVMIGCSELFKSCLDACSIVLIRIRQSDLIDQRKYCLRLIRLHSKLFANYHHSYHVLESTHKYLQMAGLLMLITIPYLIIVIGSYGSYIWVMSLFYINVLLFFFILPNFFPVSLSARVSLCTFPFQLFLTNLNSSSSFFLK